MHQPFDTSNSTIEYYNKNALSYYEQTVNIDMSDIYEPFLELIPKGGHILDAGCGSGRDTKEFLCRGYKVTAIDASEAMVKLSSQLTGQKTLHMRFQELAFDKQFDGIWACASLLHIPRDKINGLIQHFSETLNQKGIWYLSFKLGDGEHFINNRFFSFYSEELIAIILSQYSHLKIQKIWQTSNSQTDNFPQKWLNVLLAKQASQD
ncbi:class I SAM-dependent methyltransferase [Trichocoleus desertorum AS-A10]|uniref:class I SAM-dependent methyltransferase n=1 Tax=Trichocoleus desertorum TaxID=1481672 RepID=UPI003297D227